jgi:hypothetical protein
MAVSASRTSSSLNGLMIAITIFMLSCPSTPPFRAAERFEPGQGESSRVPSDVSGGGGLQKSESAPSEVACP